jgi:hypothetical protein
MRSTSLPIPAIYILGAACLSAGATEPNATEVRAAVHRALPLLQKGAVGHTTQRTCFACHNQALPMLAVAAARNRGFEINEEDLRKQMDFIAAFLGKNRDNYLQGRGQGGQVDTAGYALLTLELGGRKPDETTAAVVEYLLLYNKDLDHWRVTANRPPSEVSQFTANYLALRALQQYGTVAQADRIAQRSAVVRDWLRATRGRDTEDHVFRLLALARVGVDAEEVAAAGQELLLTQRPDGGWSQLDTMESDAYATGSALVALHEAAGLDATTPAYQRGITFLLKAQREDGSWYVRSRSKPFQTYYESRFPHGKDQFISIAASGWATAALILSCPPKDGPPLRR